MTVVKTYISLQVDSQYKKREEINKNYRYTLSILKPSKLSWNKKLFICFSNNLFLYVSKLIKICGKK